MKPNKSTMTCIAFAVAVLFLVPSCGNDDLLGGDPGNGDNGNGGNNNDPGTGNQGDTTKPERVCSQGSLNATYTLSAPCSVGVSSPTRLVISTTDFSTGAISTATAASRTLDNDVALGTTDGIPHYYDGKVYMVNRFGSDFIDILDLAQQFMSIGQYPIAAEGATSANPHAIAFRSDGLGFVTLNGAAEIQVFDFDNAPGEAKIASIDMSQFADDDGNPELSKAFACGDTLFVSAQRLDSSYTPVDDELLIPVDANTCEPYDTPITLQSGFAKQVRLDPSDLDKHTVLILTSGLERVDLDTQAVTWAVDAALFTAEGIGRLQLQAFALHNDTAYFAAYAPDYSQVNIWRAPLSGATALEKVVEGLNSVEKTLEIIGDELWYGDTTTGTSGLRVYGLNETPLPLLAGPLSTGLPPYSMIAVP